MTDEDAVTKRSVPPLRLFVTHETVFDRTRKAIDEIAILAHKCVCCCLCGIRVLARAQRKECGTELVRRRNKLFQEVIYDWRASIIDPNQWRDGAELR